MHLWLQRPPIRRRGLHKSRRRGPWQKVLNHLWPSMGFRAFVRYTWLRILRMAHQPHRVALGVAIGVFVSYSPFLGTHTLVGLALCWLLGGSYLSMIIGTWIGNPWTFWLMWWSEYEIGRRLMHLPPADPYTTLSGLSLHYMWEHLGLVWHIYILPVFVGMLPAALPVCLLFYGLVYVQLRRYNRKKAKRWRQKHGLTIDRKTGRAPKGEPKA